MNLRKISPKCRPTHFGSKSMHNFYRVKSYPMMWANSAIKKTAKIKRSPNRRKFAKSGTDVMILKIFSPKNRRKKCRFLLKTKLNYKNLIKTFF
jgi:hypothetical protein